MLIVPSPLYLGSDPINQSGQEAIAKSREWRLRRGRQQAREGFPDIDNLTNTEARKGKEVLHTDFIKKVCALTKGKIWAEESKNWPGGYNFYTQHGDEKVCLHAAFDGGAIPEFTWMVLDANGKPSRKMRGWREVLTILIQRKIITKRQVDKEFGVALDTPQSIRWQMNTRNYT